LSEPAPFPSDDALANRAREGCGAALTELYRRHAPTLLRYLHRITVDSDEAEDALQETFVRVLEARGQYEGRGRFRSWLFTIASRLVSDGRRQRKRRGALLEQYGGELVPDRPRESAWDTAHLLAITEQVLADLPEAYAQTFVLRVREDFSYAEISEILGEPEGTLRSRVHHTLNRIRRALEHDEAKSEEHARRRGHVGQ
jgi:RNA polymerase sigma-70 factor (ECF subfamily)